MSSTEHVQRFEMLESRMTGSSTGFAATVEVGFRREPSNPPSSSMADPGRPPTPPVPLGGAAPTPGKKQRASAAPTSAEKRPRHEAAASPTPIPAAGAQAAACALSGAAVSSGGIRNFFQPKTPTDASQPTLAAPSASAASFAPQPNGADLKRPPPAHTRMHHTRTAATAHRSLFNTAVAKYSA